mmetsp:Transcript_67596/g.197839  ORF Transcript_67596/g.197839 Transcript_67596/m.197839 type:complete len:226 (+) Transcript_67596:197-874(+)
MLTLILFCECSTKLGMEYCSNGGGAATSCGVDGGRGPAPDPGLEPAGDLRMLGSGMVCTGVSAVDRRGLALAGDGGVSTRSPSRAHSAWSSATAPLTGSSCSCSVCPPLVFRRFRVDGRLAFSRALRSRTIQVAGIGGMLAASGWLFWLAGELGFALAAFFRSCSRSSSVGSRSFGRSGVVLCTTLRMPITFSCFRSAAVSACISRKFSCDSSRASSTDSKVPST